MMMRAGKSLENSTKRLRISTLVTEKSLDEFGQVEDFADANGRVHRYEVIEIVRSCGIAATAVRRKVA